VITYAEVKSSPSGWPEENTTMSFQSDLTDLIDGYRNVVNKHEVSRILTGAADIVEKDEGWIYDEANPKPEEEEEATLTSIDPATAVVGTAAVTVTATGTGFVDGDSIVVDGTGSATTFVSDTQLTTQIDPTLAVAGDVEVLVRAAGGDTAPLNFTFTAA
jgi:hypothetical protein